jgi:CheY-like chemotaxis protein
MAESGNIEQAVINLCINARDAMPDGGELELSVQKMNVVESMNLGLQTLPPGNYVSIRVADNGRGIPAKYIEHIFAPFFTTKDMGKGTGLGLATVYAIVSRHEGFVTVDSAEGRGAVFTVFIPECAGPGEATKIFEPVFDGRGGSETILLAEDEPMVRNYAATILRRAGYNVIVAVDGREAVELFGRRSEEIDMLVFDVMMPRMNGRQAYEAINRSSRDPVLFCSGTAMIAEEWYIVEIDGRLQPKPIGPRSVA